MGALRDFIEQKILDSDLSNPFFITEVRIVNTLRHIDSIAFSLDSLSNSGRSELINYAHNENYCHWHDHLKPILNEISAGHIWLFEEKDSLVGTEPEYLSVGQILTYETLFKEVYPSCNIKLGIVCSGTSEYLQNYQKEFLRVCDRFHIRVFPVLKAKQSP